MERRMFIIPNNKIKSIPRRNLSKARDEAALRRTQERASSQHTLNDDKYLIAYRAASTNKGTRTKNFFISDPGSPSFSPDGKGLRKEIFSLQKKQGKNSMLLSVDCAKGMPQRINVAYPLPFTQSGC